MIYYLPKENHVYWFAPGEAPALTVSPGAIVRVETMDCFSDQIRSSEDKLEEISWERINPATGPVYVEGAKKGDALKITIERINIREQAVMLTGKDLGVLGHKFERMYVKVLPVEEGELVFDEHTRLPVEPMVGVIGVAPAAEAVEIMEELIRERTALATPDIIMLLSVAGQLGISQVVDPLKTVRFEVPTRILDNYGFSL